MTELTEGYIRFFCTSLMAETGPIFSDEVGEKMFIFEGNEWLKLGQPLEKFLSKEEYESLEDFDKNKIFFDMTPDHNEK